MNLRWSALRRADVALFAVGVALLPFGRPSLSIRGKDLLIADAFFALAGFAALVAVLRGRRALQARRRPHFYLLLAACVASVGLSVLTSEERGRSAVLAVQRVYAIGLAALAFQIADELPAVVAVVGAWLAGAAVSAVIMVGGATAFFLGARSRATNPTLWNAGSLPNVGVPRIAGLLHNANSACNLLVASAAMGAGWLAARGATIGRWLLVGALVAGAAAFTLSPGLGGLALLFGLVAFLMLRRARPRLAWAAAAVGVVGAVLMLVATSVQLRPAEGASIASARVLAWESSFETFEAHPLFGRGVGMDAAATDFATPRGEHEHLTSAHNMWLSVAAQQGVIGVATLLVLLAWLARRAWPPALRGELPALTAGLALSIFVVHGYQSISLALENQRHLWIAMGLLAACIELARDAKTSAATANGDERAGAADHLESATEGQP